MKEEEKKSIIFKYQKGKKIREATIMVLILAFILVLIDFMLGSKEMEISNMLIGIPFIILLIFVINFTYLINDSVAINSTSIDINKKIGKSIKIFFNQIRRTVIREEENTVGANQFKLTIFGEKTNHTIMLSDLDNQVKMINFLEDKGREFNFKVIYQNLNGKITR